MESFWTQTHRYQNQAVEVQVELFIQWEEGGTKEKGILMDMDNPSSEHFNRATFHTQIVIWQLTIQLPNQRFGSKYCGDQAIYWKVKLQGDQ